MPGSGRTALEAGALSVIEPATGARRRRRAFGLMMREIMSRVGADATEFPIEWGARLDVDRLAARPSACAPRPSRWCTTRRRRAPPTRGRVAGVARSVGALFMLDTVSSIRRPRRPHRRVGCGPQHDGIAEVPGGAARHVARVREPARWRAMEQRKKPAQSYATTCCAGATTGCPCRAAARFPTARRAGSRSRFRRTSRSPCRWPYA